MLNTNQDSETDSQHKNFTLQQNKGNRKTHNMKNVKVER